MLLANPLRELPRMPAGPPAAKLPTLSLLFPSLGCLPA